jgi:hypothetical protein
MPAAFSLRFRARLALLGSSCLGVALCLSAAGAARAQQGGYGQTLGTSPMERQIYDYGPGGKPSGGGSILDSTNPIDLMNKLRRGTAMQDATSPESAIDQALKDFEAQPAPSAP